MQSRGLLVRGSAHRIPLPDKFFHCCVTSPPYFGLRKYEGEQRIIWGGETDCEHDFVEHKYYTMRSASVQSSEAFSEAGQSNADRIKAARWMTDSICQKCGAWHGALGNEPTIELYIDHMLIICEEIWRVLRDDGVFWLVVGDSHNGSGGAGGDYNPGGIKEGQPKYPGRMLKNLKAGDLILMPARLSLALQAAGWIVRQGNIWYKRNPMVESVGGTRYAQKGCDCMTERREALIASMPDGVPRHRAASSKPGDIKPLVDCPKCRGTGKFGPFILRRGSWRHTTAHEFVFMLTKKMHYYCNQEAVRECFQTDPSENYPARAKVLGRGNQPGKGAHPSGPQRDSSGGYPPSGSGRNPRSVLDVPTTSYKGAHYAVYPPRLIAPFIHASCPRRCCPICGVAWAPIVDRGEYSRHQSTKAAALDVPGSPQFRYGTHQDGLPYDGKGFTVIGYRPTCDCFADIPGEQLNWNIQLGLDEYAPVPGWVLDPFFGSGTTGLVARELGVNFVGIDISHEYLDKQAKVRTKVGQPSGQLDDLPLFENICKSKDIDK